MATIPKSSSNSISEGAVNDQTAATLRSQAAINRDAAHVYSKQRHEELAIACERGAQAWEIVQEIAAMPTCDTEPEKCWLDSGPSCGAHRDLYLEDWVQRCRSLMEAPR